MRRRPGGLPSASHRLERGVIRAFALLALGDTGHVGLRVLAYALAGLEAKLNVLVSIWGSPAQAPSRPHLP
jgi:hypothetical protein